MAKNKQKAQAKEISEERLKEIAQKVNPLAKLVNKNQLKNKKKTILKGLQSVRLPIAGSVITRKYKGREIKVKVLEKGFEYEDKYFKTLSAVAVYITGNHVSGYAFFKL